MLDDLKYINRFDSQDALGVAQKQYQQLSYQFDVSSIDGPVENIVLAGMGGSALAGMISMTWPGHSLPFEICRSYHIPKYVSSRTLFIASSYSGNTEETLSALEEAEAQGAQIAVITSGGKLAAQALKKKYPLAKLPEGYQPRMALLLNLKALLAIMQKAGLAEESAVQAELLAASDFLQSSVEKWLSTVPTKQNPPKTVANQLAGKSQVVYAGPLMFPAAYKWKISFNENAKNIAWCNQFPEFNHNEFIGWTSHPVDKPYGVINLRSSFEDKPIQKRIDLTNRLLSGRRPEAIEIVAEGDNLLQQLLWLVCFGDFVTIYLALLNGLNPTPVAAIERFKAAMKA